MPHTRPAQRPYLLQSTTSKARASNRHQNLQPCVSVTPVTCADAQDDRDQVLAQRVQQTLAATDADRLRPVIVDVSQKCVRLSGNVASFYAKQLAQAAAMSVEGVDNVLNQVDVELRKVP